MKIRERIAALLGISAYAPPMAANVAGAVDEAFVEKIRKMFGGQLTPLPRSQTRFYLADLETAIHAADAGDLASAARLWRAMKRDATLAGILRTVTRGFASLPKTFTGAEAYCNILQGREGARTRFDALCPPAELRAMAADGLGMGFSLGELVPVPNRSFPVLQRRDPEFVRYRWHDNQWFYNSIAGPIAITPGDGRWVLHVDGARESPWQAGLWPALGASYIRKSHAQLHKSNWEAKLANPARAAYSPSGSSQAERTGFLDRLIAWGINTCFELPPGWDVKIIESNGRGHESFEETIDRSDREFMIAITGQVMTTDGGEGFSNGDLGENRLVEQIAATVETLAFTLNTQVLPQWVATEHGEDEFEKLFDSNTLPVVGWDTTPAKDEKEQSEALDGFGKSLASANAALAPYGRRVDALKLADQYRITLEKAPEPPADDDEQLEQDDDAEVIDLDAARAAYGRTG